MRTPPAGRTARLRLQRHLGTAARAVDVLEEKTVALAREQRRLGQHAAETRGRWEDACREAERWFLRAAVIGGPPQVSLATSRRADPPADVRVTWRSIMGVTYPAQASVEAAPAEPLGSVARSSALAEAAERFSTAVDAGLDHAAATRALELVARELAVTRRRLRALEHRWVPQLRAQLHDVELALAAQEQDDAVRVRWVVGRAEVAR